MWLTCLSVCAQVQITGCLIFKTTFNLFLILVIKLRFIPFLYSPTDASGHIGVEADPWNNHHPPQEVKSNVADMNSLLLSGYNLQYYLIWFHTIMLFQHPGHQSCPWFTVFDTQGLQSNGSLLPCSADTEFCKTLPLSPVSLKWAVLFQSQFQICLALMRLTCRAQMGYVITQKWQAGKMNGRKEKNSKKTSKEGMSSPEGGLNHISSVP